MKIKIDREYNSILQNLFFAVTFSFFSPLIIPLVLLGIIERFYLYKYMINKFEWILISKTKDNGQLFPVNVLWISIATSQFMAALFFIFSIDVAAISIIFIISLILIDAIFAIFQCRTHRLIKMQSIHNEEEF